MPREEKEVDFFSYYYDFGFQWFERKFEINDRKTIAGEISPSYLHGPGVAERAAKYNPGMRVILIVRDPIERALSNHRHEVRVGHIRGPDLSFEFGLQNNPAYIEQGLYAKHLKNWLCFFPQEQIHVEKFEEIFDDATAFLQRVCAFLGVNEAYSSDRLYSRSNVSHLNRSVFLERARVAGRKMFRAAGLSGIWNSIGDVGLRERYRQMNRVSPESAIDPPQTQTVQTLKDIFGPDCRELWEITGLSTKSWLQQ